MAVTGGADTPVRVSPLGRKPSFVLIAAIVIAALLAIPVYAETPEEKAARILRHVDDMWRGASSHGRISMQVKTRNYTRSMKMEVWS
ncbi:MAG: hypothetical protein HZA04_08670, partial [Nitrospinae bacterium]|nr:hypothetical protein [Nitrospinota bacterium]